MSLTPAQERIASYRELPNGPLRFVFDQFGIEPDGWQKEALIAFGDPAQRRISLQAAAGVGKSAVMAWCAWYFLACRCIVGEHPKGLVTGVTDANIKDNFWAELQKWQQRSAYLTHAFTWSDKRIQANDFPSTWFLGRRNWPKSGSADEQGATLSGLHSKNVATFIDESGNIPPTVLRAAEQALGDGPTFGKILQAGNPISTDGMLYFAANTARALWTIIVVNNDPDDPRCSPRGDKDWARAQIELYGRDNPWVKAYILGQFPETSLNALLGIEEVQAAMARTPNAGLFEWSQKRLGVDVARFGDDRSVIFPRQGLKAYNPVVMRVANTMDIAARVTMAVATWGSELQLIDDTGHWGHGVIDALQTQQIPAIGVNFAQKAINPRYRNRRTEMWIEMAKAVKGGLALPNIPDLVAELTTPTYTFVNGTLALEEKDQIKKRLGRSPDIADALALTYAIPDMPAQIAQALGGRGGVVATDYDPYAKVAA